MAAALPLELKNLVQVPPLRCPLVSSCYVLSGTQLTAPCSDSALGPPQLWKHVLSVLTSKAAGI